MSHTSWAINDDDDNDDDDDKQKSVNNLLIQSELENYK